MERAERNRFSLPLALCALAGPEDLHHNYGTRPSRKRRIVCGGGCFTAFTHEANNVVADKSSAIRIAYIRKPLSIADSINKTGCES